jgi:hypothetical protein
MMVDRGRRFSDDDDDDMTMLAEIMLGVPGEMMSSATKTLCLVRTIAPGASGSRCVWGYLRSDRPLCAAHRIVPRVSVIMYDLRSALSPLGTSAPSLPVIM